MRSTPACAAALAALLLTPAAASAATADGTVVGEPATHGASTVVPVALTTTSAQRLRVADGTVKLTVRRIVARTGALKAADLRFGDVVRLPDATRTAATRARGARLSVRRRGDAPSFAALDASLASARSATEGALDQVGKIAAPDLSNIGSPTDAAVRAALLDVRTDVNLRISDLRAQGRALDALVTKIGTSRRIAPALSAAATTALRAADDLDVAVGALDERINAVGTPSAPAVPIEAVGAVTSALYGILDLLRELP